MPETERIPVVTHGRSVRCALEKRDTGWLKQLQYINPPAESGRAQLLKDTTIYCTYDFLPVLGGVFADKYDRCLEHYMKARERWKGKPLGAFIYCIYIYQRTFHYPVYSSDSLMQHVKGRFLATAFKENSPQTIYQQHEGGKWKLHHCINLTITSAGKNPHTAHIKNICKNVKCFWVCEYFL